MREKREKFIFYEGGRGGGYVLLAREKEGEEKGEYLLFFKWDDLVKSGV